MMGWYAVAAVIVIALTIPLGYWQAMRRAEPPGLRGLATLAPDVQARVRAALAAGEVAVPPEIAALAGRSETLTGAAAPGFRLVTPVGIAVLQDRPVLAWEPLGGADSYVVGLFDDRGQPVGRGIEVRGPAVTLTDPLPRGRVYRWQVTAHQGPALVTTPAPPEPVACFKVLDQGAADALLRLERAQPDSHVLLGVLYLQAGVVEDARRHLRAVPADDPQAALARRSLERLAPGVTRSAAP
jgi:hypothetical protein